MTTTGSRIFPTKRITKRRVNHYNSRKPAWKGNPMIHWPHFIGLTGCINDTMLEKIDLAELVRGDARFAFGCDRLHVINNNRDLVPMEATWANEERVCGEKDPNSPFDSRRRARQPLYQNDANVHLMVPCESVDPTHRDRLLIFMAAVRIADDQGRVEWKIGNQPAYMGQLRGHHECWFMGNWRRAHEFQNEVLNVSD